MLTVASIGIFLARVNNIVYIYTCYYDGPMTIIHWRSDDSCDRVGPMGTRIIGLSSSAGEPPRVCRLLATLMQQHAR